MTRIVRPDELPLGGRVARDVLSGHAATAPLLRAGVQVTEGYRQALARAGVGGVWVDDELGDDPGRRLGRQFDPEVVGMLLEIVAPYPAGSELVLADGRRAVVVRVPAEQLDRPLVRIVADTAGAAVAPYELDLAAQPELVPQPVTRG